SSSLPSAGRVRPPGADAAHRALCGHAETRALGFRGRAARISGARRARNARVRTLTLTIALPWLVVTAWAQPPDELQAERGNQDGNERDRSDEPEPAPAEARDGVAVVPRVPGETIVV